MSESCLSQKISFCRCIETLNDDGCLKVIRLLQHSQQYERLSQFLIRIVMKTTDKMNFESLQNINNEIKQISCNNKYIEHQHSVDNKSKNSEKCSSHENIIFPLFRLPVDIIKNMSLFLNETDIFQFEQCCRLFYQMINNTVYLKQSNNFKTFITNNKQWDQILEPKYSFYKYSQANRMDVSSFGLTGFCGQTNEGVTTFVNQIQSKWLHIKRIDKYNGYWLTNLFKSINSLELCANSTMALLNKLPLKILFDPKSQLQKFKIDHYLNSCGNFGHLQRAIDEFETEYLELKEKYQQEGKTIKRLKVLDYSGWYAGHTLTGPRYIEAEHLILYNLQNTFTAQNLFSTIDVLTWKRQLDISKLGNIAIDTIRLIDVTGYGEKDICVNDKVIEASNLHRTLANLTMNINMRQNQMIQIQRWMNCIKAILRKQYYHNLKNVNILLEMRKEHVDSVFDMLKENVSISKHQFNQANIGLKIVFSQHCTKFCTFEWSTQVDEKFLNKQKQDMKGDKITYEQWLGQWAQ